MRALVDIPKKREAAFQRGEYVLALKGAELVELGPPLLTLDSEEWLSREESFHAASEGPGCEAVRRMAEWATECEEPEPEDPAFWDLAEDAFAGLFVLTVGDYERGALLLREDDVLRAIGNLIDAWLVAKGKPVAVSR